MGSSMACIFSIASMLGFASSSITNVYINWGQTVVRKNIGIPPRVKSATSQKRFLSAWSVDVSQAFRLANERLFVGGRGDFDLPDLADPSASLPPKLSALCQRLNTALDSPIDSSKDRACERSDCPSSMAGGLVSYGPLAPPAVTILFAKELKGFPTLHPAICPGISRSDLSTPAFCSLM